MIGVSDAAEGLESGGQLRLDDLVVVCTITHEAPHG